MTSANALNTILKEQFQSNGSAIREAAFEALQKKGLPHAKDEEYKYTPLTKVLEKEFDFTSNFVDSITEAQAKVLIPNLEGNHLIFINGQFKKEWSSIISNEKNLLISNLSDAEKNHSDDFKHFAQEAKVEADSFIAWNTAFAQEGLFIKVPNGKIVAEPVYLHFISANNDHKPVSYPRNLFVVGQNSQVSIVENYLSNGSHASFSNTVTEIVVHKDALVNYYKLQLQEENAYHVGTTQVLQVDKSNFTATTLSTVGKMLRNNLNIAMNAERSECHMNGLYMLDGDTHVDNHTMVDHRMPHCESNETYKGIMDGKSTAVFNGKIFVRQDAQKTNAFQSNRNILISENASVNTKPQLEIWADDVKCSHGCTVGQMDEEQLFYLRARGLSKESARAMLLHAFAADVINTISIDSLRDYVETLINQRLHA